MSETSASLRDALAWLAALGEESRLRLYALLAEGELAVGELVTILGQSQPRVSRHLKLLLEAGLVERRREGAWAFFHAPEKGRGAGLARAVLARLDPGDRVLAADRERLAEDGAPPAPRGRRNISPNMRRSGTRPGACTRRRPRSRAPFFRRARRRAAGWAPARHRLRRRAGCWNCSAPRAESAVGVDLSALCSTWRARSSNGRSAQCAVAPGRNLRPAGRARRLRSRHHPSGAALSRRSGPSAARGGAVRSRPADG